MKVVMKSSDMPKSFVKTSMSSESTHMTSSGPKYLRGGTGTPARRAVGTESISLLSFR